VTLRHPARTLRVVGGVRWVAAAGAVALVPATGWGLPGWWALAVLVPVVVLSDYGTIRVVIGRQGVSFGLLDVPIAACFVVAPGAWVAAGVALGMLVWHGHTRPWFKTSFNVAVHALSVMVGLVVVQGLGGGVVAAGVGTAVFALVNHLLTALAVSATSGERYRSVLLMTLLAIAIQTFGNISIGLLGGSLLRLGRPVDLLGLVAPLLALFALYVQMTRRASEARLFEELASGSEQILGRSTDVSAQVIVTAAARVFGGAEVELLLRHPDGPLRFVGDEHGLLLRERVQPAAFGRPWVLGALAAREVRSGVRDNRPYWSAVLGDAEHPLGCILVQRPEQAGAFTRADERLAEILVGQARSWMSVAELTARHDEAVARVEVYDAAGRVLGQIGQDTAPTLAVLREAADRLSRLTHTFDGPNPVGQIVEELHTVERAVAALLGAVRLASQPIRELDSPPGPREEWTSTGRLEPRDD
jgi:hypothetical protein